MKLFNLIPAAIFIALISASVSATEKSKHSVGFQLGAGGLEYQNKDTDNEGLASSYFFYNYQFSTLYSFEVGISGAEDIDDWNCDADQGGDWECFSDGSKFDLLADDFDYSAIVIALKSDLSLSKRNSLYGKIGMVLYDYDMELLNNKTIKDDGAGYLLEGGWSYRWDSGVGMNVGWQYQDAGDLEFTALNLGINYVF